MLKILVHFKSCNNFDCSISVFCLESTPSIFKQ